MPHTRRDLIALPSGDIPEHWRSPVSYALTMNEKPATFTTRARVEQFSNEVGWGVLVAPGGVAPGGIWFYWNAIDVPGYKTLSVGQLVDAEVESPGQDGYDFRALRIKPVAEEPHEKPHRRRRRRLPRRASFRIAGPGECLRLWYSLLVRHLLEDVDVSVGCAGKEPSDPGVLLIVERLVGPDRFTEDLDPCS